MTTNRFPEFVAGAIFVAVTTTVLVIGITSCRYDKKKPEGTVSVVQWVAARDWTTTVSNKVYRMEFGFREDGMILWRRGDAP
jgi:hypothetical protein